MRSRRELLLELAGGGEEVDAEDPPKRDMISALADLAGAAGAEGALSSVALEPKMSAKRSRVDGPLEAAALAVGATLSSPIKSTTVSLSVLVVPTDLLSLTIWSACFTLIAKMPTDQCP